jgi:hypothetical protein
MASENAMESRIGEATCQTIANIIRKKSESGQLTSQREIFQELMDQKVIKSDHRGQKGQFEGLLKKTMEENAILYPRPIPVDIFKNSPFELTQEEIQSCLQKMSDQEEYQDIAQTTTSAGTVFLYSNIHLDPGYASMLAEWLDVGQFNNP